MPCPSIVRLTAKSRKPNPRPATATQHSKTLLTPVACTRTLAAQGPLASLARSSGPGEPARTCPRHRQRHLEAPQSRSESRCHITLVAAVPLPRSHASVPARPGGQGRGLEVPTSGSGVSPGLIDDGHGATPRWSESSGEVALSFWLRFVCDCAACAMQATVCIVHSMHPSARTHARTSTLPRPLATSPGTVLLCPVYRTLVPARIHLLRPTRHIHIPPPLLPAHPRTWPSSSAPHSHTCSLVCSPEIRASTPAPARAPGLTQCRLGGGFDVREPANEERGERRT
ncbi:hypothetical protein SVAN01_05237 [Stagonosporopsis vannaccii]|nr:hypothetical protein SVAN01_05237 [Stagonosporopsis vannaccii]